MLSVIIILLVLGTIGGGLYILVKEIQKQLIGRCNANCSGCSKQEHCCEYNVLGHSNPFFYNSER